MRNRLGISQNRFTLFSVLTWAFQTWRSISWMVGITMFCKVIEEEIPYNRAQGSWWPPRLSTPSEQFYIGPVPSLVEWSHDAPLCTALGLFYPLCNLSLVVLCLSSHPQYGRDLASPQAWFQCIDGVCSERIGLMKLREAKSPSVEVSKLLKQDSPRLGVLRVCPKPAPRCPSPLFTILFFCKLVGHPKAYFPGTVLHGTSC